MRNFIKVKDNYRGEILINLDIIMYITPEAIHSKDGIIFNINVAEFNRIKARLDNFSKLVT